MNNATDRTARPPHFAIFAPGLHSDTIAEFASAWAASKAATEPTERDIAILWNLLNAFPADENRRSFLPAPLHGLFGGWRPWLEGRPGWDFERPAEG